EFCRGHQSARSIWRHESSRRSAAKEEVEALQNALAQNETDIQSALDAMPKLGPNNDSAYRNAHLELHKALIEASTDPKRLRAHLHQLLQKMEHQPAAAKKK